MKKILILGGSPLQVPMIVRAKELNYIVGVADLDENCVGKKYADFFFNVSTLDYDKLENVVQKFNPDGITTMATDQPIRIIAKLCNKFNLPSIDIETSNIVTDKYLMYRSFFRNNVPTAKTLLISEQSMIYNNYDISLPCIVKPVDSSGSRGVIKVENRSDIEKTLKYAMSYSKSRHVIIQEFLEGTEYSVETFVKNNDINIVAITEKHTTGAPHFVETSHLQPAQLTENERISLENLTKKAVKAVGITNGPVHLEAINTKNGFYVIELGARLGGDFIASHLVPYSTGIDLVGNTINISVGEDIKLYRNKREYAKVEFFITGQGKIKYITRMDELEHLKSIRDLKLFKKEGDIMTTCSSSVDRIGAIIGSSASLKNLEKDFSDAKEKFYVELEELYE